MHPFENLTTPTDSFLEKCIKAHKIKAHRYRSSLYVLQSTLYIVIHSKPTMLIYSFQKIPEYTNT